MEFLVDMRTQVPDGTTDEAVDEVRARESVRARELAEMGHLLRLWRPPLEPGEWRTFGLFAAADTAELDELLSSMPLHVWRTDDITPLGLHPNDPPEQVRRPRGELPEFMTTFTLLINGDDAGPEVALAFAQDYTQFQFVTSVGPIKYHKTFTTTNDQTDSVARYSPPTDLKPC